MLLGSTKRQSTDKAKASASIKKELTKKFPKTKFSVRSRRGDSIQIDWVNGPRTKSVRQIADKYEMGHFDGMQDMYIYSSRNKNVPQVKFVFLNRSMSPDLEKFLYKEIDKKMNWGNMKDWEKEVEISRMAREDFESHDFKY